MRKYVKSENLDKNTSKALKFFEGLIRNDIIDYSLLSDIFYELGFEVDMNRRTVDNPGGFITLRWVYPSTEDQQELPSDHQI